MTRLRFLLALLAVPALSGCALVKGWFTEPTGTICVEREIFVKTWAIVEALGELYFTDEVKRCVLGADAARCLKVVEARGLAQYLQVEINAKIAHPELTIDREAVTGLLKALIAMKP